MRLSFLGNRVLLFVLSLWATVAKASSGTALGVHGECDGEAQSIASASISLLQHDVTRSVSERLVTSEGLDTTAITAQENSQEQLWVPPLVRAVQGEQVDAGVEFIHIPKNAGTSIENTAAKYGVLWGRFNVFPNAELWPTRHQTIVGSHCSFWHDPFYLQDGTPEWFQRHEKFCVTRDPYARIVSEYKYRATRFANGTRFHDDRRASLSTAWDEAEVGQNNLHDSFFMWTSPYPLCSVEGLNHYVQHFVRRYPSGWGYNQRTCDCHFIPQSRYIWRPNGSLFCHNILRMGEFPEAFDGFMESRGSPIRMGRPSNEAKNCENVTANHLSSDMRALIESVYQDDFLRLNYSFWASRSAA